jgi:hypothetical protein
MEKNRNACSVLVGKSEEERALGKPRLRWENSINIYLKK